MRKPTRLFSIFLLMLLLGNLPIQVMATPEDDFIDELARRTYNYLSSDWATANHLPWSWRAEGEDGGDYANTAEIGFLMLSHLGAYEMQRSWSPAWSKVEEEINAILGQLLAWQAGDDSYNNSVFYQWYWVNHNPPQVGGGDVDKVVPSIDNAWLAASLIIIRSYGLENGHSALAQKADEILSRMDFRLWYQPNPYMFTWGSIQNPAGGTSADYYSNENRIINFVARALGHITETEYHSSLNALTQQPASYNRGRGSQAVIVDKAAWDGSYFTYISPALFILELETEYGQTTLLPATQAQILYASDQGYPFWGLSDCFGTRMSGYVQQGARPTAMRSSPETIPGLVTPHASAMALITPYRAVAVQNLITLSEQIPAVYDDEYGFRDSVMVHVHSPVYGRVSDRFSALNQEWIFLSIVNAETGLLWEYFYQDAGVQQAHNEMFNADGDAPLSTHQG